MGTRRSAALVAGVVLVGAAATAVVLARGGGGHAGGVETTRMRSDIAKQLPAGWSDTVDRRGDTVNVHLVHRGGLLDLADALRADAVVNPDKPEMMKLLPGDRAGLRYLFHYSDTEDKGTQLRVAAGRGYPGPHPVLLFMSKEFIKAQLGPMPRTFATPFVIDGATPVPLDG
jgi:hypothetical protein